MLQVLITLIVLMAGRCRALISCIPPTKHLLAAIQYTLHPHHNIQYAMTMKDASSAYWFNAGDSVRVVDDVMKAGTSLRGRVGTVMETWEKCDVDPTCCCAEQVDIGMAVRVEFSGSERDAFASGSFLHYFAEDELTKVKEDEDSKEMQPFDGMSCKAFKLEQLKMGEQAKRIAAFQESQTEKE